MAEQPESGDVERADVGEAMAEKAELIKIRTLVEAGQARPMEDLEREAKGLANLDTRQDIRLKRTYGFGLLIGLGVQLLIANAAFFAYAWAGVDWNVAPEVMQVWLAATVVEVVGVVAIVTRYLFPRRDPPQ